MISTYPTLWSTDIWYIPILSRCQCIAMSSRMLVPSGGSNPRVFDVQTVKRMVEPPIVDLLCSFKAPSLMLKTLAFVSSILGARKLRSFARDSHRNRSRWKELNGMTTFLQSLDDFFRDGADGALKFLVGWTQITKHRNFRWISEPSTGLVGSRACLLMWMFIR